MYITISFFPIKVTPFILLTFSSGLFITFIFSFNRSSDVEKGDAVMFPVADILPITDNASPPVSVGIRY